MVNVWIKVIIHNYHWTPKEINDLYLDDVDHFGLKYHYDTIKGVNDAIKKETK